MRVTVRFLEMTDPAQLVAPTRPGRGLSVREVVPVDPELIRRFYLAVGERYAWVDRRPWTLAQWRGWADGRALTTLVAEADGEDAGFAVLDLQPDGGVELDYFGLLGEFIGRGYGSAFLFEATRRAWALGARRVHLNTCSLDHPSALPGYLARGFTVYRVVEEERPG
jgi:GNAT superfamily N-acetyltransferase